MKIIIVEDEAIMALFLEQSLKELGHDVIASFIDSQSLSEYTEYTSQIDLILFDILIKGAKDGIQAAQEFKKKFPNIPIAFITSYKDSDTIQSAQTVSPVGYLIKPINISDIEALLMVVKSSLKNSSHIINTNNQTINFSSYVYEKENKQITEKGVIIKLSLKELLCLEILIKNKNKNISHEQLSSHIWQDDLPFNTSALRELIFRIRKKLPDLTIQNNPNMGYILID